MRLSGTFPVPRPVALLYDFVNSLDLRTYVERGETHVVGDELATPGHLEDWMLARDLQSEGVRVETAVFARALALREALRGFLALEPAARIAADPAAQKLAAAAAAFPLLADVSAAGGIVLRPAEGTSGLAQVVAELHEVSVAGDLGRLRLCASSECRWMFYDRTKPGNRRWCSSALCGNRQKTRAYRDRRAAGKAT